MDERQGSTPSNANTMRKEGNQCIALGAGVGGLGATAAMLLGATCPLCFIVAPGLIGVGLYRRAQAKQAREAECMSPNKWSDTHQSPSDLKGDDDKQS